MAEQNDELTHQVRISYSGAGISVSCNCRVTTGRHEKAGKLIYDPIGYTTGYEDTKRLFNNSENHWEPFTEGDKIR
jgi:hypothetical protein